MKQLDSFVGLANFLGRMLPDFATKMLPLNEIWKKEFRWEKEKQNAFENIKNQLCADNDDDNDRVCFAVYNIYFVQSNLETQLDIKTELGSNWLFQDAIKQIKSGIRKKCSEAEKGFE